MRCVRSTWGGTGDGLRCGDPSTIRGTDTGRHLAIGANAAGQWTGYHGTPIDADAPDTGSPDSVDRLPRRSYPFGSHAQR